MIMENKRIAEIIKLLNKHIQDNSYVDDTILSNYHDNDIATALQCLDKETRIKVYPLIGYNRLSDIFEYMDNPEEYISELDITSCAKILENMDVNITSNVLEEFSDAKKSQILQLISEDTKQDISLLQSYSDEAVGSKMTTNFVTVSIDSTIKEAMKSVITQAADNDNISIIYALKNDGTFYGAIYLTDLIIARKYDNLESLVVTSYPFVFAHELIDDCIENLKDYSEDSIPVLDSDMKLLGVITSQDLITVVDEELGEDYAMLAGLSSEEELDEPLKESIKKRIPWLTILLFLGLLVSVVVGKFENLVKELTIIASFQSVITGMSGNAGTQSLAVTIRILSDSDIKIKERLKLVFKEAKVGVCNGLLIGLIAFAFSGLFIYFVKGNSFVFSFTISACIGGALIIAMFISGLVGTLIPMFFDYFNIDPAVASGPLITTVNDLIAVITYYGLVSLLVLSSGLSI